MKFVQVLGIIRRSTKIYNIEPDLTTLGKGMANGMPLSALVGKEKCKSLEGFFLGHLEVKLFL